MQREMHPLLAPLPPDEFKRRLTITQLTPLVEKTMIGDLQGLPYPVRFRNQSALEGWRQVLDDEASGRALWQRWAQQDLSCEAGMHISRICC